MPAVVVARAEEPHAERHVVGRGSRGSRTGTAGCPRAWSRSRSAATRRAGAPRRTLPAARHGCRRALRPRRGSTSSARTSSDARAVPVEGRREAQLQVGRTERGVALDQRERCDEGLGEGGLRAASEDVVAAGALRRLRSDRRRQPPEFGQRVRDQPHAQEPRRVQRAREPRQPIAHPRLLGERQVALQHVLVVGIEPRRLEAERLHDAPAIRHRDRFARQGRGGRGHLRGIDDRRHVALGLAGPGAAARDLLVGARIARQLLIGERGGARGEAHRGEGEATARLRGPRRHSGPWSR